MIRTKSSENQQLKKFCHKEKFPAKIAINTAGKNSIRHMGIQTAHVWFQTQALLLKSGFHTGFGFKK